MSNYTDFDALSHYPDVTLNYVFKADELGEEDIIILPGSKSTIADLQKLKDNGIYDKVIELHNAGTVVVGICGGFQMLGQEIRDPHKLEGDLEVIEGFGLLNTTTVMEKMKCTQQVKRELVEDLADTILEGCENLKVRGYEIHQGVTDGNDKNITLEGGYIFVAKENIFGTYIHGIFDNEKFTRNFLNNIRKRKGLEPLDYSFSFSEFKENEYNKLANLVRENLDMSKVYKIMQGN